MVLPTLPNSAAFQAWLTAEILRLSVETLKSDTVTCTACSQVLGTYIIDYHGNQFRCTPEEAYAFLKFIEQAL